MRILIGSKLDASDRSRSIRFLDLPELMAEQGQRISAVAIHDREDPAVPVDFEHIPPPDTLLDVPVSIRVIPYSSHHQRLDRQIVFEGLAEVLQGRFGRMVGPTRHGDEIAPRVRLAPIGVVGSWSEAEVQATVADYFAMLESELAHRAYSKSDHRRALLEVLNSRSEAALEFKHQNISAVLRDLDLPYIEGYKPASTYQDLLADEILNYLDQHPELLKRIVDAKRFHPDAPSSEPPSNAFESLQVSPPPRAEGSSRKSGRRQPTRNVAAQDAANKRLGKDGEKFALKLEKQRLIAAGRPDLGDKVEWVSQTKGDGMGFDILSFEVDGSDRFIEVKTTGGGIPTRFFITEAEVLFSEEFPEQYHLYRLFCFGSSTQFYLISGNMREKLLLEATQYRATP